MAVQQRRWNWWSKDSSCKITKTNLLTQKESERHPEIWKPLTLVLARRNGVCDGLFLWALYLIRGSHPRLHVAWFIWPQNLSFFFFFLNQVCMCKPRCTNLPHLCLPSPKGLKLSCHGDGTQVLQWLPRHLWCHQGTRRGNSSALNSPRVQNYLILAETLLWLKTSTNFWVTNSCHAIESVSQWSIQWAL